MINDIDTLFKLTIRDLVEVYSSSKNKHYEGPVVRIFRANLPRDPAEVKKYYQMDSSHEAWPHVSTPSKNDVLVIEYERGRYLVLDKHPATILCYGIRVKKIGRVPRMRPKPCAIPGCTNRSDQGKFIGDYCAPCYNLDKHSEAGRLLERLKPLIELLELRGKDQ